MKKRQIFFRIKLLKDLLSRTQEIRLQLLDELIDNATDPVIIMRRFRMLSQLSTLESQLIEKIYSINTDHEDDFKEVDYIRYIYSVADRNG